MTQFVLLRTGEQVTKGSVLNVTKELVNLNQQHPLTMRALVEAARNYPEPAKFHRNSQEILSSKNLLATNEVVQREARLVIIAAVIDNDEGGLRLVNPVAENDPFYGHIRYLFGSHFT